MSAETLRKAAEKLREQANAATPGPWSTKENFSATSLRAPADNTRGWRNIAQVDHWRSDHNAAYIAAMHPGVGFAFADLLDHVAEDAESNDEFDGFDPWVTVPAYGDALNIARMVLGGESA